ncbi:MAG: hypothetical protein HY820_36670 [Acidobacteria bacterium]|nr:hypothetical protein [Acidobacteriota bacterium]
MKNYNSVRTMFAGLAMTATCMMAQTALPVKTLYSGSSVSNRDTVLNKLAAAGFQEVPFSSTNAELGSMVEVNNPTKTAVDAKRTTNAAAAVYTGVVKAGYAPLQAPAPATSGAEAPEQHYDFKKSSDGAQAWATMQSNGMPYISVKAIGGSKAHGAGSWKASLTVPVAGQHLYAYMLLPEVSVSGNFEANGPGRFQARFTADLQMNGHPAWSSEAVRSMQLQKSFETVYTDASPSSCSGYDKDSPAYYLTQFGDGMHPTPASWGLVDPSPLKFVILDLGVFPAGQKVDLTFLGRLQASNSSVCCGAVGDYFCSRGEASVKWHDEANPVRLWFGPAIP